MSEEVIVIDNRYDYLVNYINRFSEYLEGVVRGTGVERDRFKPAFDKLTSLELTLLKLRDGLTIGQAIGVDPL